MVRDVEPLTRTLQSFDQWLAADLADPAFRAEWDRSVMARAVSHALTRYRSAHGISQTTLGEQLGMSQTQISRLEQGEHTPTFETLLRIADVLDLELSLTIGPKVEPRREVPTALKRNAVCDATDQVVISVREA